MAGMTEGMQRHKAMNGGAPQGWRAVLPRAIRAENNPTSPLPTIYAIISTWHDADIIEATVKNCFAQGCSRVFILDNASPDDTLARAVGAGAEVAHVYETQMYDDDLRISLQNEIVRKQTELAKLPELWWFVLDADELPCSFDGQPIAEKLRGLPSSIRVVGTDFVDLYPSLGEDYAGGHPATTMTKGVWRRGNTRRPNYCAHWKHAIIRLFNGQRDMAHNRGNHTVTISRPGSVGAGMHDQRFTASNIFEPMFDLFMFHVPIRGREATYARLEALCKGGRSKWDDQVTGGNGAIRRWRSLDNIYNQRWQDVELPHTQMYGREVRGLALYPWRVLVPSLKEHSFE